MPDQQTRRRRAPGRRFLAPSSDAVYTSTPPRRLESTSIADPGIVVELVGAAVSIRDEPECVSDAILDSYGRDAAYFQSVRHAAIVETAVEARASLPVESRLRDAWERAKKQHRQDLRGELLAVDKAVEKARRGQPARLVENADGFLVSEPRALVLPAAALGRLELVEAKLDRAPDLELLAA